MPFELTPLAEDKYQDAIPLLHSSSAKKCADGRDLQSPELWSGPVKDHPEMTAYWYSLDDHVLGYVMVRPLALLNLLGREVVRGWVSQDMRGRGLFARLLVAASEGQNLISDRDGMTRDAYLAWLRVKGLVLGYYDQWAMGRVEANSMPTPDTFSRGPTGSRWLMVLSPMQAQENRTEA